MKGIIKTQIAVLLVSVLAVGVSAEELSDSLASVEPLPGFDCLIEPGEMVDIGSPVPGVIERVYADLGDYVEMGGALTKLDSKVEQAALELARTRANSTAEIELQHENAEFSKRLHSRNQELFQKSVISSHDMDRFETEQRIAQLQKRQAENNNRIAQLEYRRALELLKQRTILSPINGVVTEKYKSVGEYVDDEPLLRLAQLDPLHVEIIVPAEYWGRLMPGQLAEVTPQFLGVEKKVATIERIDPVVDSASGTFRVQLQLPNPEHQIAAGLKCQLVFLSENADVITAEVDTDMRTASIPAAPVPLNGQQPDVANSQPETMTKSCFSVGPVTEEKIAQQLTEQFEAQNLSLTMQQESQSVLKGYRVHSSPLSSLAKARALVSRLKAENVQDLLVAFDKESNQHVVYLGLFQKKQNAIDWAEMLSSKGFEVQIKPRYQESSINRLHLSLVSDRATENAIRKTVSNLAPQADFEPVGCEQLLAHNKK